nr:MAG TPA: hypothetical protein [Caudoviricetes sp.]
MYGKATLAPSSHAQRLAPANLVKPCSKAMKEAAPVTSMMTERRIRYSTPMERKMPMSKKAIISRQLSLTICGRFFIPGTVT